MRLEKLAESWSLDLRVQRKSPRTIETYLRAVHQLDDFLEGPDIDSITVTDIRRFLDWHLTTNSDSTARQRYGSLSVFFGWLVSEGEISENPMGRVKPPKVEDKPIDVIDPRVFRRYLDTCDGSFKGRRDFALLWLLWDTGARLGEITGIKVGDIDWQTERVFIEGKSGFRRAPYTPETARALNRYSRARDEHRYASAPEFWLGEKGPLTDRGISQAIVKRGRSHDLPHIHVHQFRHTMTDRLLSAGASEGDTLTLMGWSKGSRSMLDRYAAGRREDRAFQRYRDLIG